MNQYSSNDLFRVGNIESNKFVPLYLFVSKQSLENRDRSSSRTRYLTGYNVRSYFSVSVTRNLQQPLRAWHSLSCRSKRILLPYLAATVRLCSPELRSPPMLGDSLLQNDLPLALSLSLYLCLPLSIVNFVSRKE